MNIFVLVLKGNHNAANIRQRCETLQSNFQALLDSANSRKTCLIDNSAFLQFIWKTDVVESWIADKETQVRSEDYGRDLSSVQTLLTKQETFDAGLQAFEKEGIQTITALKDQLIAASHAQTIAIEKRYNDVITRLVAMAICLMSCKLIMQDLKIIYCINTMKSSQMTLNWFTYILILQLILFF